MLFRSLIGDYIMFILTVILFSGSVSHLSFDNIGACENAMYDTIDRVLPKNVKAIDCKRVG